MPLLSDASTLGPWTCVNDGVMGGQSTSRVMRRPDDGVLQFAGAVSLANNGGFASTKARCSVDLSGQTGIMLRLQGPPCRYRLTLRTEPGGRISYRVPFWATPQPATHYLPFAQLRPMRRGQPRPDAPPFAAASICEIGFLIGDKQAGDFVLHVHRIQAYAAL
ncbi:CIA30 family protein [Longimonas halophila]|nr:CIA30 family protein [Longimonas halophila]